MPSEPTFHRVYQSINRPLAIWGAERRLFFLAMGMGGATFNFFGNVVGGLLMFVVLLVFGRWATVTEQTRGSRNAKLAPGRAAWIRTQPASSRREMARLFGDP